MIFLHKRGSLRQALDKLGISNLYPWQAEAIGAVLGDDDVFISAPTGGGKSAIFQIPAVMEMDRGLTITVSPLRALQVDQVQQLRRKGVPAELLNSDLSGLEREAVLSRLSKICLLYLAPEQLKRQDLRNALQCCHVQRIVVDEAHILPQTELDFRPAYGEIRDFVQGLSLLPQIVTCTATATPKERKRIVDALGMINPQIFSQPIRRDNLNLSVKQLKNDDRYQMREDALFHAVERALPRKKKGSVIIYCPTVGRVERLQKWLAGRGWTIGRYTGEMSQKERCKVQEKFQSDALPVIAATNAFGLGIDKPDVRLVIHAGLPLTLSGYVQEIGRAGRDGAPAECLLFYAPGDVERNKRILSRSNVEQAVQQKTGELYALKDLMKSKECLWCGIERYYGEKPGKPCGHCLFCVSKQTKSQL